MRRISEPPSQDELYHRLAAEFGPMMGRLARTTELDADKRRDLMQTMNFALWRSLTHFKGQCAVSTWVYRVVHNAAADHARQEARRSGGRVGLDAIAEVEAPGDLSGDVGRRDALAHLHAWVSRLDFPDRPIVTLYLEDVPAREIAEVTGLSPGAVATRISRLKFKLHAHFEEVHNDA